jgi:HSP20 family protein
VEDKDMNISDLVPWKARQGSQALERRAAADPFLSLQQDFERLYNEFFDLAPWSGGDGLNAFNPRVNVTEHANAIEVTAELPGLDEKDVDISLSRDILTIKGEKKEEREEKQANYYRTERVYGSFCRTIGLPAGVVDVDNVEASFKNGVLTITLPKRPQAEEVSRRISVKTG